MRAWYYSVVLGLVGLLFLLGCAQRRLSDTGKESVQHNDADVSVLEVPCDWEGIGKKQQLRHRARAYKFKFNADCPPVSDTSQYEKSKIRYNVIFLVDLKIEPIQSVLSQVDRIANGLVSSGADSAFAAIGFEFDENRELIIPFKGNVEEFQAQLHSFGKDGAAIGKELQTPSDNKTFVSRGLKAIDSAFLMLEGLITDNSVNRRRNALIFYVSNHPAIGAAGKPGFGTEELAKEISRVVPLLGPTTMVYSVPEVYSKEVTAFFQTNKVELPGAPKAQMEELKEQVKKLNVLPMAYPFSGDLPITATFQKVTFEAEANCRIDSLGMASSIQSGVPEKDMRYGVYDEVKAGKEYTFKISEDPNALDYFILINRICDNLVHERLVKIEFQKL